MKSEKRKENYFRILKYQCINTLVFLCLILLIFFIYTTPVYASSMTLSSSQTTLSVNDEFVVDVQLSINASDGTIYYLRGEFYLTDGQYCGYTWNGNSWFNGSVSGDGYKNLQQISITSDAWAGQLKAKIDSSDGSCVNSGNYFFKIQRYTNTGNSSTDTMTPLTISVIIPTPSPSPTPTPTPTNSPTTSPTQAPTASPTKSPTPIPTPVKTASPKPTTPKPTPTESGQTEESLVLEPQVLSLSTVASSAEPKTAGKNLPAGRQDKSPILAILLVFSGVCFLGYGGYMLYNQTYENKTNTN